MKTNRQILEEAIVNKKQLSFLLLSNPINAETNVKIVFVQGDDVANKEFTFETKSGNRYTNFENNIKFIQL
jgi:hypothetical protein